jgi:hypothetical protein
MFMHRVVLGFEVTRVDKNKSVTKSLEVTGLIIKRVILEHWY